jgi:hypothetical protein
LKDPAGPVSGHFEDGQTRQWVLAGYEREPSENGPHDDESGDESSAADKGAK